MKAFVKVFIKRGALFCGGGPFIVAIVYMFILGSGEADTIALSRTITEILSSLVLAFIAAGVTAVYTVERLQYPTAALIHGSVIFIDYLGIYLLNGWIPFKWQSIALFAAIFVTAFLLIVVIIYKATQSQIKKLNSQIQ